MQFVYNDIYFLFFYYLTTQVRNVFALNKILMNTEINKFTLVILC